MKSPILLLLILMCVVFSCRTDEEVQPNTVSIVPLRIGTTWTYSEYVLDQTVMVEEEPTKIVVEKMLTLKHDGESIRVFQLKQSIGERSLLFFANNTPSGYIEYGFVLDYDYFIQSSGARKVLLKNDGDTLLYHRQMVSTPVRKNEKWQTELAVSSYEVDPSSFSILYGFEIDQQTVECISLNEQVATPMGNFSCIGIKYGDDNVYTMSYYAEGIGKVKDETYVDGELVSYRVLTGKG